jgi:hypothetical protein
LTALVIVGTVSAGVYFCYKLAFGNKEKYFQFDDRVTDIQK